MEVILELFSHVISDLTNTVKSSISDLRVRMCQVLNYDWDHWCDLLNIIYVFTNL